MANAPTGRLTPMLRHYLEVKEQHPDALLFYRMGDFYELFFEDAERAAPLLEVTLTARQKGSDSEAPMCGVPYHALDNYLAKAVRAGHKVAVCEQVEDPATAKGMVRREVVRVVTPGTLSDPSLLDGKEENAFAVVLWDGETGAGAWLEISTGAFAVRRWSSSAEAADDLSVMLPREVVVPDEGLPVALDQWLAAESRTTRTVISGLDLPTSREATELLQRQLGVDSLRGFGLDPEEIAVRAAAQALRYAEYTQRTGLDHVRELAVDQGRGAPVCDATTLANLEVFRNLRDGSRKGTLLSILDRTRTAPGGRCLRAWLRAPLTDPVQIERRLEAVDELLAERRRWEAATAILPRIGDPERLLSRAVLGTITPREAAVLRESLAAVPELFAALGGAASPLLAELVAVDPLPELAADLARTLVPDPPATLKDGGFIAEGVDSELDRHRELARDSKRHLLALEAEERRATGIASLKIRYNRVFGYYLEVTRANQELVPDRYIRKQTLANAERYITPELKELEDQILHAEERQLALEGEHFRALGRRIAAQGEGLRRIARTVARIDVLAAFTEVAERHRYARPRLLAPGGPIRLRGNRHPVVERTTGEPFVPNDLELDAETRIVLLTGPNMGGKSTYLRQVALSVLMAQCGSFVPAEAVELGPVDRIFTRVGASDDLARGESTFMVEMVETANILRHATPASLVVLDEVGRGTATFDGLSLAWAIVEHLHEQVGARTLFATHYHELTELAAVLPGLANRKMAVKEWGEEILFLRRVVAGTADKSYGLQVARLAGIPPRVIERAGEVLGNLEAQEYDLAGRPRLARGSGPTVEGPSQLDLFAPSDQVVVSLLREVDVDGLTPLAALNLVASLKDRLGP